MFPCVIHHISGRRSNDDDERRVHRLTWHEGKIPADEIWVKLGGDKGGGSFKMAPDNVTNLKIALQRFEDEVDSLQSKTWRGKTIRVFLSGDYEFLCNIYGLSGASGRQCCLWCLTTSEQLRNPPTTVQSRSTASMVTDHHSFIAAGGILKNVKNFNNCVREPFFKCIPLNQVCPPGLHISLGIFYRLFQLMEDECRALDNAVLWCEDSRERGGPSYSNFMSDSVRERALKDELDRVNEEVAQLNDLVALLCVFGEGEEEDDPRLSALRSEFEEKASHAKKLDAEWTKINEKTAKGYKKEDGPFVKALDAALEDFNVRRQTYYGGTFVGNHVNRTLQVRNIEKLAIPLYSEQAVMSRP
ncbi:uncharacterized protein LOC135348339 isoform X1 [Halichondria panicea]|uniref:uncharacterized protein LOC135348339 isoform X1 n=1 Tax=Halichondria panicea TaxID=6063 RepID=UPI00312B84B7